MAKMIETPVRHAFMRSTDNNLQQEYGGTGRPIGRSSSEVGEAINHPSLGASSTTAADFDDTKTLDPRLSTDRTRSKLGVAIPYPMEDQPSSPPSLPFIAPLHLQNTENYEQWVERERAEAIVKRRSLSEMERLSPMKRRLYSPSCASGVGSPPRYQQYINPDKDSDICSSQYLPKLLDEPESNMECSRIRMGRARSNATTSTTSSSHDIPGLTSSKGKEVADATEADLVEDVWLDNSYEENLVRWKEEFNELRNRLQPQCSVASTLTGAFTTVSEPEESLAQILTRLKTAGAAERTENESFDLIDQHINCVNVEAGQTHRARCRMPTSDPVFDDTPEFIFSPDGQAQINAELEELRKEALTYQSVRGVCTSPQLGSPNTQRIRYDPDKINYGTFEYVPFNINTTSGSTAPKVSVTTPERRVGNITIQSRPPVLVPKPKRKRTKPFNKAFDWIYEKLMNLGQSVVVVREKRWHIPTQRFVPRGSSLPS